MTRPSQLALELGHRPALGREDFLVAASNAEAVAWIDRWPDWPAHALGLFGPAGSGKTHLAEVWRERSRAPLHVASAIAGRAPESLLGGAHACAVEEVDRGVDERALLHLVNVIRERAGQLLLTGRTPPARWPIALPDLASRLKAAPAVALKAPDDALLGAVLVKLFADRQLRVTPEVVGFLLARIERSVAAARLVVGALDRAALAERRKITVSLVRRVLVNLEPGAATESARP